MIKKTILNYFKDREYNFNGREISRAEIYVKEKEIVASRTALNDSFALKNLESVSDKGIREILKKHLSHFNEVKGDKIIEHPELAFSAEGIEQLNEAIMVLNNGKPHKPVYKVRICEPLGLKFKVGLTNGKDKKYVEAAKGTNLFFAVYEDREGKRSYETIPLNMAIERQKQGLAAVPDRNQDHHSLSFFLSPNDLVYVPTQEELETGRIDWEDQRRISKRIYKTVSFTGNRCYFIPATIAFPIISPQELGANNKSERSWEGEMIRQICIPVKVDRLGNMKRK